MKTLMNIIPRYRRKPFGTVWLVICILLLSACSGPKNLAPVSEDKPSAQQKQSISDIPAPSPSMAPKANSSEAPEADSSEIFSFINRNGGTLETRFSAPSGYKRILSTTGDLTQFIRTFPLKKDGSDVLLYDGTKKSNQNGHAAVFDLDIGERDLQQCADSILRIYSEYYWSIKAYDKIAFHLTNGFYMKYTKWRDGNRLKVDGNKVSWVKTAAFDDSYKGFRNYLTSVFTYAGTLSLSQECSSIQPDQILPGDMFLQGGSPGHCVMVVDVAKAPDGQRCFLLAQGYMPAQSFHVLKNPLHEEDPWYYESELTYPFKTPLWTFEEGSLVRWNAFTLNETGTSLIATASNQSKAEASGYLGAIPLKVESSATSKDTSTCVTLLAVGDNLIHTQVISSGKKKDGTYNYDHLYSNIKNDISAADIAIINQETIFGGNNHPFTGYPRFNSPTQIGDALVKSGFDVVLQATNHTMDMGVDGIKNTLAYWKKYPQITVLGINKSKKAETKIKIIEKNGIKIALLNYTYSLNGIPLPKNKQYLVDRLDKDRMSEDIKKAEKLADITIVFPHWGTEYVYTPNNMQKELTQFFYEQGVDLVIGTHPHVLEPVEWIGTGKHRMLVYYSLGNFISYQKEAPRMLGGMAHVTITKDKSGTYISDASIVPLVTHYENGPADYNYAVYKLSDYNETLARRHGVSKIAQDGPLTYQNTLKLAKEILGKWYR